MKNFIFILLVLLAPVSAAAEELAESPLVGKWKSYQFIGDKRLASGDFRMVLEIAKGGAVQIVAKSKVQGDERVERDTGSIEGSYLKFHGKNTKGKWTLSGDTLRVIDEEQGVSILFRRMEKVE